MRHACLGPSSAARQELDVGTRENPGGPKNESSAIRNFYDHPNAAQPRQLLGVRDRFPLRVAATAVRLCDTDRRLSVQMVLYDISPGNLHMPFSEPLNSVVER